MNADNDDVDFSAHSAWRRAKDCSFMWNIRKLVAHSLMWLAAIAAPAQAFPVPSCGCSCNKASASKQMRCKGCCCSKERVREGDCCCTQRKQTAAQSCCSNLGPKKSVCNCGVNCRCGKTGSSSAATVPVCNKAAHRAVIDLASSDYGKIFDGRSTARRQDRGYEQRNAVSALDRCVSLCRFTV